MTKEETFWSTVKFALLLLFSVTLLYILLCKFVMHVPMSETTYLVEDIDESEQVLQDQRKMKDQMLALKAEIDSLNFEIQQMQRTGEIKARIAQLQDVYKQHNHNPKYLYSVQAYKAMQRYFDIKENLSYTISDNQLIEGDLEKIKANI